MFTKTNYEDDWSLPVNLTNDHQICETDMSEFSHQLSDDVSFVCNESYEENQFASKSVVHRETSDKEKILFGIPFDNELQSESKWSIGLWSIYRSLSVLDIGDGTRLLNLLTTSE